MSVAVGAIVAVGGTAVGTDVAVGAGVGVSASQAKTRSIEDSPAIAIPAMLIGTESRNLIFESFNSPCSRGVI